MHVPSIEAWSAAYDWLVYLVLLYIGIVNAYLVLDVARLRRTVTATWPGPRFRN